MTRYTVRARRSGKHWALDVPALPGVFSQSTRLDTAPAAAAEAIALMLDVEPDTIQVDIDPQLTDAEAAVVRLLHEAKADNRRAEERAARAAREAAALLVNVRGLSLRDAGDLLGMSHQRVSQLLQSAAEVSRHQHRPRRKNRNRIDA